MSHPELGSSTCKRDLDSAEYISESAMIKRPMDRKSFSNLAITSSHWLSSVEFSSSWLQ